MTWKLVDQHGKDVSLPFEGTTFRGEKVIIASARAPHKPGSSGFICLDNGAEYYPSVCNLKWISA